MSGWLIAVVVVLAGLLVAACSWVLVLQVELRKMTRQLDGIISNPGTNERVRTNTQSRPLSRFAAAVNRLIESSKQEQQQSRKAELDLKREITNISHDLRTPLTSIKGFSDLLSSSAVSPDEKAEYLSIVQKKIDHLVGTVDLFFELSQLDSLDSGPVLENVPLDQIIIDTMLTYHKAFEEKGFEVRMGRLTAAPALADRKAAGRIVVNIIQNALAYGKNYIAIELIEDAETMRLRAVNDTDAFDAEELERIFDRTYRVDPSRGGGQLGLGLHIVRQLAEKQGGSAAAWMEDEDFVIEVTWKK
ncbi:two-component sensor histidine kinase [Sporosarcina sp. NCCP-2716]|uniref:sensor histidine kinase n=1 Tax=Sporosarcina sp. NCCP-2716 TaxID=2943679 RepID=UPI00203F4DA2|nr:HAMP domain-containing sensor histidine kinase [Sporosarcina sp. NCCP-2716]GKV69751.1 two-component sensor histidine kinase [Sporosarcina sp. NCCP-2716]